MNRKEFVSCIDIGHDILFTLRGRRYTICPDEDGADIAERGTCANRKVFRDGESLLDGYMIDGKPLGDRLAEVVVDEIY